METINVDHFGQDPKIKKAVSFAENVAVTKAPILIVGEVGTGKRTLGHHIHDCSNRKGQIIVLVDCAKEKQDVENSILGHRDAESGRFNKGALEKANGGSVILLNIDALEEDFQKRLHKIFQELSDYEIDVRVISTTTKNLSKLVGAGRFYRGLYTYLSGTQINLTPLRERIMDIQFLAEGFARATAITANKEVAPFTDKSMAKLRDHYWTHNIGELKSVVENTVLNDDDGMLDVDDLSIGEKKTVSMIAEGDDDGIKLMSLKEAERLLIKKALIHTSENRTQAAKILGVSIRTLRNKINEYRSDGNQFFLNLR